MSDLISLVMKAAERELLHREAGQVDQEMEELLAEMALAPVAKARLADFTQHFFALLKRRGDIAQRALGIHEADGRRPSELMAANGRAEADPLTVLLPLGADGDGAR